MRSSKTKRNKKRSLDNRRLARALARVMDESIFGDLPDDVFKYHIAPHLSIDVRLALRVPPKRLSKCADFRLIMRKLEAEFESSQPVLRACQFNNNDRLQFFHVDKKVGDGWYRYMEFNIFKRVVVINTPEGAVWKSVIGDPFFREH